MRLHTSPCDVSHTPGLRTYYAETKARADARTRSYRRRYASGETQVAIAEAEGITSKNVSRIINRILPEDHRDTYTGASHGLTRGQVVFAMQASDEETAHDPQPYGL